MISPGLKKAAKEIGLTVDSKIAYGEYRGYVVTMSEGMGYKQLAVSTKAPPEALHGRFEQTLGGLRSLRKEFRVLSLNVSPESVVVQFSDTYGTMKKYRAFIDWFIPKLDAFGFTGSRQCALCGEDLQAGDPWKLDKGVAHHVHAGCASMAEAQSSAYISQIRADDTGSYGMGLIGSLTGALLGAIPWAVALYFGFFVSMLGYLIAFFAQKGYDMARGRLGKGKIAIVILTSAIGVIAGNILGDVFMLAAMVRNGEIIGASLSEIPSMMIFLVTDGEYLGQFVLNLGMGMVFAFLGMVGMIRDLKNDDPTAERRMKTLQPAGADPNM